MLVEGQPRIYQFELDNDKTKQLTKIVKDLDSFCFENRIPYFFTAAVSDDGNETKYQRSARTGLPMGIHLSTDQLVTHLRVCRGAEAVFPESLPDMILVNDGDDLIPMEIPDDYDGEESGKGE